MDRVLRFTEPDYFWNTQNLPSINNFDMRGSAGLPASAVDAFVGAGYSSPVQPVPESLTKLLARLR